MDKLSKKQNIVILLSILVLLSLAVAIYGIFSWRALFKEYEYIFDNFSEEDQKNMYDLLEIDKQPYTDVNNAAFIYGAQDSYSIIVLNVMDGDAEKFEKYLVEQKSFVKHSMTQKNDKYSLTRYVLSEEYENAVSLEVFWSKGMKWQVVPFVADGNIKYCFIANTVPQKSLIESMIETTIEINATNK